MKRNGPPELDLPEQQDRGEEERSLQKRIRFIAQDTRDGPGEADRLRQLRRAIVGRHTVRFHYHARYSRDGASARSIREADPYGLVYVFGVWHLVAYCHLRE